MKKVLWITNMPTMYRVHFFNELGKYCDLTVMFDRYHATGVENKWDNSYAKNFTAVFYKTIDIGREGAFGVGLLKVDYKKYDKVILSSYSSPAEMLALCKLKMQKIPYALEVDGGIIKNDNPFKKKLKTFLISGADMYFSTGDSTSKYLTHYGAKSSKIKKYHFSSLYNSDILEKEPTPEEKKEIRTRLGFKREIMLIGVGRFIKVKGFDILLKAAALLKYDIDIVIIGGEPTAEYHQLVDDLKLKNVSFISEISKEALAEYYKAADIFVLPTRGDMWGLVINEAMAKGLPVITTDHCVAGLELIEDEQNGYIVKSEDYVQLANRINILSADRSACAQMGKNNLEKIKNYTFEQMAKEHYEILFERGNQ